MRHCFVTVQTHQISYKVVECWQLQFYQLELPIFLSASRGLQLIFIFLLIESDKTRMAGFPGNLIPYNTAAYWHPLIFDVSTTYSLIVRTEVHISSSPPLNWSCSAWAASWGPGPWRMRTWTPPRWRRRPGPDPSSGTPPPPASRRPPRRASGKHPGSL